MSTKIIQVVGLPGSGKSTKIVPILAKYENIIYINYVSHIFLKYNMIEKIKTLSNKSIVILESACGLKNLSSFIIQLKIDNKRLCSQLYSREHKLDLDLLSLLETEIVKPDVVTNLEDFDEVLSDALRRAGAKLQARIA